MSGNVRLYTNIRTADNINADDLYDIQIMDGGGNDKEAARMPYSELLKAVGGVQNVKVSLSSEQLISGTKVVAVASPGVGLAIEVINMIVKYKTGAIAFDVGTYLVAHIDTAVDSQFATNPFLAALQDQFMNAVINVTAAPQVIQYVENKKLEIYSNAASTVGDGSADVYISYRIIIL